MKAKDYAAKFGPDIYSDDQSVSMKATSQLLIELYKEVQNICDVRHVKFDRGILPIVREQNSKWNAVCRILEKEYGRALLKEDGYIDFLNYKIPGIKAKALNLQSL